MAPGSVSSFAPPRCSGRGSSCPHLPAPSLPWGPAQLPTTGYKRQIQGDRRAKLSPHFPEPNPCCPPAGFGAAAWTGGSPGQTHAMPVQCHGPCGATVPVPLPLPDAERSPHTAQHSGRATGR